MTLIETLLAPPSFFGGGERRCAHCSRISNSLSAQVDKKRWGTAHDSSCPLPAELKKHGLRDLVTELTREGSV